MQLKKIFEPKTLVITYIPHVEKRGIMIEGFESNRMPVAHSVCHVIPGLVREEPITDKELDMRNWRILLFILLALVIVFALQNTQVVDVQFFFWTLSMSRALILLGTLVIGLFAGWLVGKFTTRS
jgi:putative membrane protein